MLERRRWIMVDGSIAEGQESHGTVSFEFRTGAG